MPNRRSPGFSRSLATIMACASLSACASLVAVPRSGPPSPTASAGSNCAVTGAPTAFQLMIAPGFPGEATPEAAAKFFVRNDGMPGYGTTTTTWTVEDVSNGVILRSNAAWLHVVRLSDGGWAVDSGGRCS
jgi:hypothetical protein